jgi:hypothetical protein
MEVPGAHLFIVRDTVPCPDSETVPYAAISTCILLRVQPWALLSPHLWTPSGSLSPESKLSCGRLEWRTNSACLHRVRKKQGLDPFEYHLHTALHLSPALPHLPRCLCLKVLIFWALCVTWLTFCHLGIKLQLLVACSTTFYVPSIYWNPSFTVISLEFFLLVGLHLWKFLYGRSSGWRGHRIMWSICSGISLRHF